MSLVRMHNKKSDVTYVYESTNFWDKEKRKARSVRRLIGKVDPKTGNIILTNRKGRMGAGEGDQEAPLTISLGESEARARIVELEALIHKQQEKIWLLQQQNLRLTKTLTDIIDTAERARTLTEEQNAAYTEQQENRAETEAAALAEAAAAAAKGLPVPSTLKDDLLGDDTLLLGGDRIETMEEGDL